MKIGVVLGSVREGRLGESVAQWVAQGLSGHEGVEVELLDVASYNLPLLSSSVLPMMANKQYDDDGVQAWSQAVDGCDAFIFVTPEYNHSVPGSFKNAVDSLGPEFVGKSIAFVGYGADGGVRAVEHWRQIVANFSMHDVRAQVSLGLFTDFADGQFAPMERRGDELNTLIGQLVEAAK